MPCLTAIFLYVYVCVFYRREHMRRVRMVLRVPADEKAHTTYELTQVRSID
jgi:hypothetical protein